MHFLAFAFKTRSLHVASNQPNTRRSSAPCSARYDMLYAIRASYFPHQATIARVLGVAGVTVSRMIRKLEALGFVRRVSSYRDRRVKVVRLTELGRRRLYLTLWKMKRNQLQWAFMRRIRTGKGTGPFLEVDNFYWTVRRILERLGDRASFCYPTMHPDD